MVARVIQIIQSAYPFHAGKDVYSHKCVLSSRRPAACMGQMAYADHRASSCNQRQCKRRRCPKQKGLLRQILLIWIRIRHRIPWQMTGMIHTMQEMQSYRPTPRKLLRYGVCGLRGGRKTGYGIQNPILIPVRRSAVMCMGTGRTRAGGRLILISMRHPYQEHGTKNG